MELWYTEEQAAGVRLSLRVERHLHSEQSPFQKIDVFETPTFGRVLTLDGLMMVNEKDEFIYHDMIVHVPMATSSEIKNVLVIGGGDGGTVRELCRYPHLERIDMVEIDRRVVDLAREYLPFTAKSLDDPRVSLFYEDGIAFIEGKESVYDLILVDSTDPIGPGEGLFSRQFYENCYRALTKQGILVNQNESPYYAEQSREFKRAYEKISEVFEVAEVYQFHMPTYPSGHWLFGYASKGIHPTDNNTIDTWDQYGLATRYYNTDLHRGAFALPTYVKEMMNK
jgi:spermidine synthase